VGFAMGISGTEVAKESSDIILMDDNFASIVKAVMWGRNVFDSIRKFLQFQLTVNVVAVLIAFIGAVSKGESPLSAVQMLWVNLIMDTMAALALATESPTMDLLDRPPHGRTAKLITPRMWRLIIGQAVYQLVILLVMLYAYEEIDLFPRNDMEDFVDVKHFNLVRNTCIFNTFVFMQLFNEFNARKLDNEINVFSRVFENMVFVVVQIITLVIQILLVQFAGPFAKVTPLNLQEWIICVVIGLGALPIGAILKLIPVKAEAYEKSEEVEIKTPLLESVVTDKE